MAKVTKAELGRQCRSLRNEVGHWTGRAQGAEADAFNLAASLEVCRKELHATRAVVRWQERFIGEAIGAMDSLGGQLRSSLDVTKAEADAVEARHVAAHERKVAPQRG